MSSQKIGPPPARHKIGPPTPARHKIGPPKHFLPPSVLKPSLSTSSHPRRTPKTDWPLRTPTPYTEHQSYNHLLTIFARRVEEFWAALSLWVVFGHGAGGGKTQFGFNGEFSTVARDFDLHSRRDALLKFMTRTKESVERVFKGRLRFSSVFFFPF